MEGAHIRMSTSADVFCAHAYGCARMQTLVRIRTRMHLNASVRACGWLSVGEDTSVDAERLQQLMTNYFSSKHQ